MSMFTRASLLYKSPCNQLSKLSSLTTIQQRNGSAGFTPADMPIIKQKWAATSKVAKICESMKNVAAGALPGCERHLANARPFCGVTLPLFVLSDPEDGGAPSTPAGAIKNVLHVPIGTERGMCGTISSNTVRAAGAHAQENPDQTHKVIVYGKRSASLANTIFGQDMIVCAGEVKTKVPTFEFCCFLAEFILYSSDFDWDKIILYFNEYENAVKSHLRSSEIYKTEIAQLLGELQFPTYEIEADIRTYTENLIEYKLAASLYMYMAENAASEQGSRLRSMDSAFKNCQEKETEYESIYQGLRKTKITNELIILAAATKIATAPKD